MSTNIRPEQWISQAEAARLRGVSRQAISKLVMKKRLRTLDIGGTTFVFKDDVIRFVPKKGGRPRKGK